MKQNIKFSEITLRLELTDRGGGIEIDLTKLGFPGEKMSAFQNYLGGDIVGRICVTDTITAYGKQSTQGLNLTLEKIAVELKKYFFMLKYSEVELPFNQSAFDQLQAMPGRNM